MKVIDFNTLNLNDLNFVMIDGHAHIAVIDDTKDEVVLKLSLDCGTHVEEEHINSWIKKGNLGELSTLKIKGEQRYTVADIPSDMRLYFEKRILTIKAVLKTAVAKLVNDEFDRTR